MMALGQMPRFTLAASAANSSPSAVLACRRAMCSQMTPLASVGRKRTVTWRPAAVVLNCQLEPVGLSVEVAEIHKHTGIIRGKLMGLL